MTRRRAVMTIPLRALSQAIGSPQSARVLAGYRAEDGPLSVRARPSRLKHDCDRRTTSTGEKCLVNVHAKSCLIPEPLRTLRTETKGQAGACPDRTRAIPCTVRAVTTRTRAPRSPGVEREWEPRWEPRERTTSRLSGRARTADRDAAEVTDCPERDRTPARVSTDQKVGGSSPSERAMYAQVKALLPVIIKALDACLGACRLTISHSSKRSCESWRVRPGRVAGLPRSRGRRSSA